ncbi:MAG TPA: MFS transporter, partial [Dehalococcoidia bacterium]|nr:MFS transporter [Dehalococcoidia bacterium]
DRRWWIFGTIAVGILLGSFTNSSLNAVLPVIRDDLEAPMAGVQWVLMSFLLVNSSLLLSMGRLGDLIGHRRVYLSGLGVFTGAVILAITAGSLPWLIGARVGQAMGAAMLVEVAPAITTLAFPPHHRGRVLGMQATTVYVGLALGPSVGGFITDRLGWRAVFFVCLPLAAATAVLAWRFIPAYRPKAREGTFDVIGAVLFMIGLVALLYALTRGSEWGWLAPPTLGLIALSAVLLTAFVLWEGRHPSPMLDLGLFKLRLFRMAVISSVLNFICFYGLFFLMPFYLITARGWSAGQAGVIFMALPLSMASVAPFSGLASDRIGSRVLASAGMIVLAIGLVILGLLGETTPPLVIAAGLVVCGLGIGLFTSPNNSAIMGSAPIERRGVASGVVATARSVGMVLGIALTGALFTSLLALNGGTVESGGPPFLAAMHWTCWAIAGCALAGAVTSYRRGGATEGVGDRV